MGRDKGTGGRGRHLDAGRGGSDASMEALIYEVSME